jgi:UDP-glucuronate decarboxylase
MHANGPRPAYPAADLREAAQRMQLVGAHLDDAVILVTGASGFVGSWLAETFVAARQLHGWNAKLLLMTRAPDRLASEAPHLAQAEGVQILPGDLDTDDGLTAITGVTHVLHAAAAPHRMPDARARAQALDTTDLGTRRLLLAAEHWPLRKWLYVSSGGVYGTKLTAPTAEDFAAAPDPASPHAPYAIAKRVGEVRSLLAAESQGFDAVIARLWAFVGPGLPADRGFALADFVADARAGRSIAVRGDGTPVRSYQYAADMAVWLWTLLVQGMPNSVYNVGSARAISIAQLAHLVKAALGGGGVHIAQVAPAGTQPDYYVPNVEKVIQTLGLANTCDLEAALQRMADWQQARERRG